MKTISNNKIVKTIVEIIVLNSNTAEYKFELIKLFDILKEYFNDINALDERLEYIEYKKNKLFSTEGINPLVDYVNPNNNIPITDYIKLTRVGIFSACLSDIIEEENKIKHQIYHQWFATITAVVAALISVMSYFN